MVNKSLVLAAIYLAAANGFRSMAPHGRPTFGVRRLMSEPEAPVEEASAAAAVDAPTSSAAPVAEEAAPEAPKKEGFAQFEVGQAYTGSVVGAKTFGVFVDIKKGTNVLLPRSQMTRGGFERLKRMADSKSKAPVKLELIAVSAENSTLSGKYVSGFAMKDVSQLKKSDSGESYEATVVGTHDFGLFAELDEYGVEGLVPASKLPDKLPAGTVQASYPVGSTVKVQVDEFKDDGKKLVLSMKLENRAEVGAFSSIAPQKWLTGVVESITNFGLFVRPAGYENVGLVHISRVPRDLLYALKKVAPIPEGTNKTDIENLFQAGDVVKVRTHAVSVGARRIELSMLPFQANEDDEDDYVVEGRDPEPKEGDRFEERDREEEKEEEVSYDAEDTLLWWRGAPYVKTGAKEDEVAAADDDFDVLNESVDVVEGTWRRMFEVDMREDEADLSSKALEAEIKELEEEIGELNGLDEDLIDAVGFGQSFQPTKIGSFVSMSAIPADWKEEMEFFKELELTNTNKLSGLRAGKASEQAEFESLLKVVELELEQAAARSPRRPEEPLAEPEALKLDVVEPAAADAAVIEPAEASA